MPDWVKEQLALDIGTNGALTARPCRKFSPRSGLPSERAGGAVKVQFENAPANMRIRDVSSTTPILGWMWMRLCHGGDKLMQNLKPVFTTFFFKKSDQRLYPASKGDGQRANSDEEIHHLSQKPN